MAAPRFSVLIPTRERPATLRHTLQTVVSQPGDDYEVIVADNCSGPETREIVEQLRLPNVRYTRADEVVPMSDNWERGLDLCSGEYVTVLGDDDGFLPSTLQLARRALDETSAELLSWTPHTYWWPDAIVPWTRDILVVDIRDGAKHVESRPLLEKFYRNQFPFGLMPMIYCAFFHRGIIEEARIRYDGFFVPRDVAPDISSAILGLHITHSYVYSSRALTVRGNSGTSNGSAHWFRSGGAALRDRYYREERVGLRGWMHPALIPSPSLHVTVASTKMKCAELYFPDDPALKVDPRTVLDDMLFFLASEPEAYEDNLRDIEALAAKLGVTLDRASIPPREARERIRAWGPSVNPDNSVHMLNVNGALAGVKDIAGAARLIESLLPPAETYLRS